MEMVQSFPTFIYKIICSIKNIKILVKRKKFTIRKTNFRLILSYRIFGKLKMQKSAGCKPISTNGKIKKCHVALIYFLSLLFL
jgi:hypothetical protein